MDKVQLEAVITMIDQAIKNTRQLRERDKCIQQLTPDKEKRLDEAIKYMNNIKGNLEDEEELTRAIVMYVRDSKGIIYENCKEEIEFNKCMLVAIDEDNRSKYTATESKIVYGYIESEDVLTTQINKIMELPYKEKLYSYINYSYGVMNAMRNLSHDNKGYDKTPFMPIELLFNSYWDKIKEEEKRGNIDINYILDLCIADSIVHNYGIKEAYIWSITSLGKGKRIKENILDCLLSSDILKEAVIYDGISFLMQDTMEYIEGKDINSYKKEYNLSRKNYGKIKLYSNNNMPIYMSKMKVMPYQEDLFEYMMEDRQYGESGNKVRYTCYIAGKHKEETKFELNKMIADYKGYKESLEITPSRELKLRFELHDYLSLTGFSTIYEVYSESINKNIRYDKDEIEDLCNKAIKLYEALNASTAKLLYKLNESNMISELTDSDIERFHIFYNDLKQRVSLELGKIKLYINMIYYKQKFYVTAKKMEQLKFNERQALNTMASKDKFNMYCYFMAETIFNHSVYKKDDILYFLNLEYILDDTYMKKHFDKILQDICSMDRILQLLYSKYDNTDERYIKGMFKEPRLLVPRNFNIEKEASSSKKVQRDNQENQEEQGKKDSLSRLYKYIAHSILIGIHPSKMNN